MRGIMQARKKPLEVMAPLDVSPASKTESFQKPAPKGEVKLIAADDIDTLIDLLHNEAKVI